MSKHSGTWLTGILLLKTWKANGLTGFSFMKLMDLLDYGRFDIKRSALFKPQFKAQSPRLFFYLLATLNVFTMAISPAYSQSLLWQTNSAGNDVHIIDIETKQLVKRLIVGPEPHGIAAPKNADVVYISIEHKWKSQGELIWIDPKTYQITHRIKVGKEPQAIATTPNGRWIYVPCRDGYYWVVDALKKQVVKKIYTGGRPHNTQASNDGRFMYLSPMGSKHQVSIVSIENGHQIVGTIGFSDSVRPPALMANQQYYFQHVDGLNGFEVAHIPKREVTAQIHHSHSLGYYTGIKRLGWIDAEGLHRCHGLAIRRNQSEIWSTCGHHLSIHSLASHTLEKNQQESFTYPETQHINLKDDGYWLTFSPDDRFAFIALRDANEVVMIDTASKETITHLKVGEKPKRNLVIDIN